MDNRHPVTDVEISTQLRRVQVATTAKERAHAQVRALQSLSVATLSAEDSAQKNQCLREATRLWSEKTLAEARAIARLNRLKDRQTLRPQWKSSQVRLLPLPYEELP